MSPAKFPRPGLRILKSASRRLPSAFLIDTLRGDGVPFYSAIAAILCMQPDVRGGLRVGLNRVVGTLIGGLYGMGVLYLLRTFLPEGTGLLQYAIISAALVPLMYLTVLVKKTSATYITCVVFLSVARLPRARPRPLCVRAQPHPRYAHRHFHLPVCQLDPLSAQPEGGPGAIKENRRPPDGGNMDQTERITIPGAAEGIPALLWGPASDRWIIAVHGNFSHKADRVIALLARRAAEKGYRTLSFDLPQHGERAGGALPPDPPSCVSDLGAVYGYRSARGRNASPSSGAAWGPISACSPTTGCPSPRASSSPPWSTWSGSSAT